MKKTENISILKMSLTMLFVVALVVSNVITAKQVQLPLGITMTAAVIVFPITYILSDVFSEVYGYRWSRLSCYMGFAANIFAVLVFSAAIATPAPDYWTNQEAFQAVLGNTPRVLAASLIAFLAGDLVNDKIFKRLKANHPQDHKGFGWRAILSSLCGEITDSAIFLPLAFIGEMPVNTLLTMMICQVGIKTLYEILILPITTKIVKIIEKYEEGR